MKKKMIFMGIFSVMLILGMVLAGCPNDSSDSGSKTEEETKPAPTTATITVTNNSGEYKITRVVARDADTGNQALNESVEIAIKGGSQSFTVDPGKYTVTVTDSYGDSRSSVQFTLAAGGSKSLTYTGLELY